MEPGQHHTFVWPAWSFKASWIWLSHHLFGFSAGLQYRAQICLRPFHYLINVQCIDRILFWYQCDVAKVISATGFNFQYDMKCMTRNSRIANYFATGPASVGSVRAAVTLIRFSEPYINVVGFGPVAVHRIGRT